MYRNPLGLTNIFREPRIPGEDTITMDTACGFVSSCPLLLNVFPHIMKETCGSVFKEKPKRVTC